MNFAEKLIDWKENNQEIQYCETKVHTMLNTKANSIVKKLKEDTAKGEIGLYTYKSKNFLASVQENMKILHNKNVSIDGLSLIFYSKFNSEINNIIVMYGIEDYDMTIFYLGNVDTTNDLSSDLLKIWFEKFVLPDFEESYKNSFIENIKFLSHFSKDYYFSPITTLLRKLNYTNLKNSEIIKHLETLAEEAGLQFNPYTSETSFSLTV